MNVWLLKDGENLPVQQDARRMRTWMLADALAGRGHSVIWWASTHSHQRKTLLFHDDREVELAPNFRLRLLFAGAYRKNRSVRRYGHHLRLAARFRQEAPRCDRPDIIVCSFPIIELAFEAVRFSRAHGVPIIIDIRDPWPDAFMEMVPRRLRAAATAALGPVYRKVGGCLRGADSLVACSQGFLDWGMEKARRMRRPADRVFYLGSSGEGFPRQTVCPRMAALREELAAKVIFCFVGTFGHVYQLRLVCEVAAELQRHRDSRIHIVLAGDGVQFPEIAAASRTLGNLTLLGWLNASESDDLLAISDVALAPIKQMPGCLPNKIFEYSAAGLPIVSSLEGETARILSKYDAGLSYLPGDLRGLLEHMKRLSQDQDCRQRQAANSLRMFRQELRASRIYAEYVDHIEAVAERRDG